MKEYQIEGRAVQRYTNDRVFTVARCGRKHYIAFNEEGSLVVLSYSDRGTLWDFV